MVSDLSPVSLARATSSAVLSADGNVLAKDMRAGSLALYQATAEATRNFVVSPIALQLAVGMVYLATGGETADELSAGMRWSQAPAAFGPAQENLLDVIGGGAIAAASQTSTLVQTATRAFVTSRYRMLPTYAQALTTIYQAPAGQLDFFGSPELSLKRINAWVGEQTDRKLGDVLPSGSVDINTALVLTAALHFEAYWPAPLGQGSALTFTTASGQARQLSGLSIRQQLSYRDTAQETAVRLSYRGGFTLLLVRPKGDLADYSRALTAAVLEEMLTDAAAVPTLVDLTLPAFDVQVAAADLAGALTGLGIKRLFVPTGELVILDPAQTPKPDLQFVNHIYQTAHVSLDAQGTETEAPAEVSSLVVETAGQVEPAAPPVPVVFDKPFLFFVQDVSTGSVFLMGHVVDPEAS